MGRKNNEEKRGNSCGIYVEKMKREKVRWEKVMISEKVEKPKSK